MSFLISSVEIYVRITAGRRALELNLVISLGLRLQTVLTLLLAALILCERANWLQVDSSDILFLISISLLMILRFLSHLIRADTTEVQVSPRRNLVLLRKYLVARLLILDTHLFFGLWSLHGPLLFLLLVILDVRENIL